MQDIRMAPPLARALAAKGYETLTAVQEAVLAPNVAGRDLLVSAQTGSGKTVAFGLAIAPEVLDGQDALLFADKPLALIVAPTRELAQQVQREFEWLYADARAHLASCVGGMDYRTEKRTLERGAHIVVGTPGRLRDHIERGSLDLSQCRAVVLDEADEMLDLGFAEDLEFILSAAPQERRTLMFSATVPKEIETLARNFQTDALRIAAKGEARQHDDIEYRALSVTARDKEHAIFNLLRFYESQTAIVFAKTRANVNHLFARMVNRGFQVVALSGELSQTERMHALQALRDGRARVCIATDVAARGIDLPGLELVIHADLPSNSETMLHRSGRTGRAGNKGVSALIVVPAEVKKAQRLLQGAKVTADWGKAPSAEDVQTRDDERLLNHPDLMAPVGDEAETATTLLQRFAPESIAAAFIRQWRAGRSAPEVLAESLPPPAPLPVRERGEFGASVWFRLSVGHEQRAEARWLLPKICEAGGIAKDGIGAIRVKQTFSFVQIAAPLAARFGAQTELEPGLMMEQMDGEPDLGPTSSAPRSGPRKAPREFDAPRGEKRDRPARPARESYGDKPRAKESYGDRPARPPRESYGDKPARPAREYGASDASADRKPRTKPAAEGGSYDKSARFGGAGKGTYKAAGFKSHGDGPRDRADAPAKSSGFKSHAKPDARAPAKADGYKGPAKPRSTSDDATRKPYAGKRSDVKPGGKPSFAKKPSAAGDTSKRFVPPKKQR